MVVLVAGYNLSRRLLAGLALLLLAGAGLAYLLLSGSDPASRTAGRPGTSAASTAAATTSPSTRPSSRQIPFQAARPQVPPPKELQRQATQAITHAQRLQRVPADGFWLGPSFRGLRPYRLRGTGDSSQLVYSTPERFPKADGVYVNALKAKSPSGRQLLLRMKGLPRLRTAKGSYAVVSTGSVVLATDGYLVQATAIGTTAKGLTAATLAAAIRR